MRLYLADDQPKVRHALRVLLEKIPDTIIVGDKGDSPILAEDISAAKPDVLIIDWLLLKDISNDEFQTLLASAPQIKVVALSSRPELEQEALRSGADAFISKIDPPDKLLDAVLNYQTKTVR